MKALITFLFSLLVFIQSSAQINAGPMLGYSTMREVAIWVQTSTGQKVYFEYIDSTNCTRLVDSMNTSFESGYCAQFIANMLEPGAKYYYQIYTNLDTTFGEFTSQSQWANSTQNQNLRFAMGSCAYFNDESYDLPGEQFGKGTEIFQHIVSAKPNFMLWLGDNTYFRESDYSSWSGMVYRYSHFKSHPDLALLWKSMHHYAIWDDHDYGPNDSDRSFELKDLSLKAFKSFWANQIYGSKESKGIYSKLSYGDADFFLLDNRYFRSPNKSNTGERTILGEEQEAWLLDALITSKASFKFIVMGGQFLNPAPVYENYANYGTEVLEILNFIERENLHNIIFLSGDRHKSECSVLELNNGALIYDYTSSPLTAKAYDSIEEENQLRVDSSHVATQNFGLLEISGNPGERILHIKTIGKNGDVLWEKRIKQQAAN